MVSDFHSIADSAIFFHVPRHFRLEVGLSARSPADGLKSVSADVKGSYTSAAGALKRGRIIRSMKLGRCSLVFFRVAAATAAADSAAAAITPAVADDTAAVADVVVVDAPPPPPPPPIPP